MYVNRPASSMTQVLIVVAVIGIIGGIGAAVWLGSKPDNNNTAPTNPNTPSTPSASSPSDADGELIAKQKICPVTEEPLGSMGGAYRDEVDGKVVFLCCKGCSKALHKDPAKYLEKLK